MEKERSMSEASQRLHAYVDANVLIEFRQLDSIPWREVLGRTDAVLVISRVAFDELDKFKDAPGPPRKKRQRAAKTAKWLSGLLFGNGAERPVRIQEGLYVDYDDAPLPADIWTLPGIEPLDPVLNDHRQVAHLLLARKRKPEHEITFVTHDCGAGRAAAFRGLPTINMPEDHKVADEPDPEQKELLGLRKRLAELESRAPKLVVRCCGHDSSHPHTIPLPQDIDDLTQHLNCWREAYPYYTPMAVEMAFEAANLALGRTVSTSDKRRYNNAIDHFHDRVAEALPSLLDYFNRRDLCVPISLVVANEGSAPAMAVEVELRISESLEFALELPPRPDCPKPPDRPVPRSPLDHIRFEPSATMVQLSPLNADPDWTLSRRQCHNIAKISLGKIKHQQDAAVPPIFVPMPSRDEATNFNVQYTVFADNTDPVAGRLDFRVVAGEKARHPGYFVRDLSSER